MQNGFNAMQICMDAIIVAMDVVYREHTHCGRGLSLNEQVVSELHLTSEGLPVPNWLASQLDATGSQLQVCKT